MNSSAYHLRRLMISYSYEFLLKLISWALRIKKHNVLILFFAISCIGCGIAFAFWPVPMAALFDFQSLSLIAETDIRAYYGTFLIAMGIALAWLAADDSQSRTGFLIIAAFSLGSAAGRALGFFHGAPVLSIHGFLIVVETLIGSIAFYTWRKRARTKTKDEVLPVLNPKTPEDFQPLSQENFSNPYEYYRMLRDHYPVYKMPQTNFYMISRYEDICAFSLNTEAYSSKLMEILVRGKPKPASQTTKTPVELLGAWGVVPVDVLALQDQPVHTSERKVGHAGFNAKFVKSLEGEVTGLCQEMMNEFLPRGNVEFIQDFAWRLPMRLIIRLLGFPESDFEQIKLWCMDGIRSLSGTATVAELISIGATNGPFMRYLWRHYLLARKNPQENFTGMLIRMVDEPPHTLSDQQAVAIILQLLIAGSDSSASSMGNAIRLLAQHPEIEAELRAHPERIPDFIEEVFRCESAFQGHFRVSTTTTELHGVTIPADSRVFLMWASGNRDERFWDNPDEFKMNRTNGKKHLTFGHGIHACLGRELARMEIRIVIRELLARTKRIVIVGETPFVASIFARTLVRLPLAFELADDTQGKETTNDAANQQELDAQTPKTGSEDRGTITGPASNNQCPFANAGMS
jgi:cytochrome P450